MSALEVGQVVEVTLPKSARRLGLPANMSGVVVALESDGEFAVVRVQQPERFADFVLTLPTGCLQAEGADPDPARCRGTQESIRSAIKREIRALPLLGPRLYTHDDFDRETLAARGEALPFAPRSERQWAYVLLMAQHVEWVEIDAPGTPAPVRITVRLDDQAPADDPLVEIARLVEQHRTAGEVWEVSAFVPGMNR